VSLELHDRIREVFEDYRELMGLHRWVIRFANGRPDDLDPCKGACLAMPEYREATLVFDLERFETGDDIEEMVVHEMVHCLTWEIVHVAEVLAMDDPRLKEWVRFTEERHTTDLAEAFIRLRHAPPKFTMRPELSQ